MRGGAKCKFISLLRHCSSEWKPCRKYVYFAIKCGALLFAYPALGDKFIPLRRYYSCDDYQYGVALPRLVGLDCSTCNTTDMKVAVGGRARPAVSACLVPGNTGVRP